MKKMLIVLLAILMVLSLSACTKSKENQSGKKDDKTSDCNDGKGCDLVDDEPEQTGNDVKSIYESLNGKTNAKGNTYRSIEIPDKNRFEYISQDELLENLNNPEWIGIVVASDPKCPWCRSVLPTAIELATEMKMGTIYILDVWDEEGNEIWRDRYELDEEGKPQKTVEAAPSYQKILDGDCFLLEDYILKDEDGKEIPVGEKRVYAPNFLYFEGDHVVLMTTGVSELQTDPYQELTPEIQEDMKKIISTFYDDVLEMIKNGKK